MAINDVISADRSRVKGEHEIAYWRTCKLKEGTLSNGHYEYFYTTHFGLTKDFYMDKRVLDIGCGPRGSLEWADMTRARVGLDPLARSYRELGIENHKMLYVASPSEEIPFPAGYFDVVCSFNSLDHVDSIDRVISEIIRVTRTGGLFLLLSDLNHQPTFTEPVAFSWDIVDRFKPGFEVLLERHFEKLGKGMYASIRQNIPYNHADPAPRYGIISSLFRRVGNA